MLHRACPIVSPARLYHVGNHMKRFLKILFVFAVGAFALTSAATLGKLALVASAQEKKEPPIDWQKLLADLRERLAKSQEPEA